MSTTWINRGHFYAPHVTPVLVDCNFVVDSTNGNGLGIRNLKGQGIKNIFMNTSATPGSNNGYLNPNPAAGYILVQFADNFNRYYGGFSGFVSPVSGTPILVTTGVTAGLAYTIVSVGTTTTAQWQSLGLPAGVTPAVGATFIAPATATTTGTGAIEVPLSTHAGVQTMTVIGDPNTTISPIPMGSTPYVGGWLTAACLNANALTAPADGSVIGMAFYMSQSSVVVLGE
jgi:hypothetical protein